MKPIQPKEHPTFKRAIGMAHKRLMAKRDKLSTRVEELLSAGTLDEREASNVAMAEMAQQAYREAVETLENECSRRARIEYVVDGAEFLEEACRRMLSKGDGLGPLIASALSQARAGMPGQVRACLDFGCREDGLVFGKASHEAIGGSFATLQATVARSLDIAALEEARMRIESDGTPSILARKLAPQMVEGMRPALLSIAAQSLPSDDAPGSFRPLSAHIEDLCDRLSRLDFVEFSADAESRHVLTGSQACARLRQISAQASLERPDAAALSSFFNKLGF